VRLVGTGDVPLVVAAQEEDSLQSNAQQPVLTTVGMSLSLTDEGLEDPLVTLASVSDTDEEEPLRSESAESVSIRDTRLPSVLFEHACKINARDDELETRCSFTMRADVDGYRIFLKSGVRLQQFLKVRYCLQKSKFLSKTSVSVKVTDDGQRTLGLGCLYEYMVPHTYQPCYVTLQCNEIILGAHMKLIVHNGSIYRYLTIILLRNHSCTCTFREIRQPQTVYIAMTIPAYAHIATCAERAVDESFRLSFWGEVALRRRN
jgi:hypothetical protein